ncbi:MAG: zf-HC2 domain-containing protein [Pirellulales bacterium]
MRCQEVLNQLNARADGELQPEDAAEIEAHLAECDECRSEAETIDAIVAELRQAFVPRREAAARLAEGAAAAVRVAAVAPASVATRPAAAPRFAWAQILAGLAAGFLLAVTLFRPWQPLVVASSEAQRRNTYARMTVASAPVEVWTTPQDAYRCPSGGEIKRDSIVRTGPDDRCEISLLNGNALRLDCNTEVRLLDSDVIEVNRGRLSSVSPPGGKGLEIKVHGCPVGVGTNEWAQVAVDCKPDWARLIVVNGTANVPAGQKTIEVGANKQVRIADGKMVNEPEWCDTALETAWVNSVLALSDSDHPELAERVNRLLANVGAAKLSELYEDELRRLGDPGVPPLLAYLASTRETPNLPKRATAARIVADVAESRWIGDLILLLTDANADVRVQAARGLERLTGRNQGLQAQAWQSESWATCEPPYKKWLDWWAANRDHYPAARRDIVAPQSPPF